METTDTTRIQETSVTSVENKMENAPVENQEKKVVWKDVLVGGIPGIALGVAGSLITSDLQAKSADEALDEKENLNGEPGDVKIYDAAPVAHNVNDEMSFAEAFDAARDEVGAGGVFEWHGQIYGTYYQTEWASMNDEQRHEYSQSVSAAIDSDAVEVEPEDNKSEATSDELEAEDEGIVGESDTPEEVQPQTETEAVVETEVAEEPQGEADVRVLEVGYIENEDGSVSNVGVATVDGQDALFVDGDDDGRVEILAVDVNSDGEVQDDEIIPLENSGLTMDDLVVASALEGQSLDSAVYDGTPDYTNDADVSDLA